MRKIVLNTWFVVSIVALSVALSASPSWAMRSALLVVGDTSLGTGDAVMAARLQALGFEVIPLDSAATSTADAAGHDLVVISATVSSSQVHGKFRDVPVPVLVHETWIYDDMGMTGAQRNVDIGRVKNARQVEIVAPGEFLAAGLAGIVDVTHGTGPFMWGAPGAQAIRIATVPGDSVRHLIFGYEAGTLMPGRIAPARRLGFFLDEQTAADLTDAGLTLLDAAILWTAGLDNGLPPEPDVAIVSPAAGRAFALGETMAIQVEAPNATRIRLLANGTTVGETVGESHTFSLTDLPEGLIHLTAMAIHDDRVQLSEALPIRVGDPKRDVLLVVDDGGLEPDDQAFLDRLSFLGYPITLQTSNALTASDAEGKALIVVAISAHSFEIADTLTAVDVPVLTSESWLYDDLGMTGPETQGEYGREDGQTRIDLLDDHPLSAGLGDPRLFETSQQVMTAPRGVMWGRPSLDAVPVGSVEGDPGRVVIFGYEAGAEMITGQAPARRVGFFPFEGGAVALNRQGWALFDAASAWAAGFDLGEKAPRVTLDVSSNGSAFAVGAPVDLTAQVSGDVAFVEFFAYGTKIGQATSEPFSFTWQGAPEGLLSLRARAVGPSGLSRLADPVSIVVGTPGRNALLIYGCCQVRAGDQAMIDLLSRLGFAVTAKEAGQVRASDADGQSLILISSTAPAGPVGSLLADTAVPIVTWNPELYEDLGLTGAQAEVDFGQQAAQVDLDVIDGASLGIERLNNLVVFAAAPETFSWGAPNDTAQIFATLERRPERAAVFGYEAGVAMPAGVSPARRLALPLGNETASRLTPDGELLVEGAIAWTQGLDLTTPAPPEVDPPTVTILSPTGRLFVDPTLADPVPNIEVTYADSGSGVDLGTVEIRLNDDVSSVDLASECRISADRATCPMPIAKEGGFEIVATVRDLAGNTASARHAFAVDFTGDDAPPTLILDHPADGQFLSTATVVVDGTVTDDGTLISLTINGQDVDVAADGRFRLELPVPTESSFLIQALAIDASGRLTQATRTIIQDDDGPTLEIVSPQNNAVTTEPTLQLIGSVDDNHFNTLVVAVNGTPIPVDDTEFSVPLTLADGRNPFTVTATDAAGNQATANFEVVRASPPAVTLNSPTPRSLTGADRVTVTGTVDEPVRGVTVAGVDATLSGLAFSAEVTLREGSNLLSVVATDLAGSTGTATVQVFRDSTGPESVLTSPADGARVSADRIAIVGTVQDISVESAAPPQVTVNGRPATVENGSFLLADFGLTPGENVLTVAATDAAGNTRATESRVIYEPTDGRQRIERLAGHLQTGTVRTALAEPLAIRLVDAAGDPLAGETVIFEITGGDGTLAASGAPGGGQGQDSGQRQIALTTDTAGQASADLRLGSRAGRGSDRVEAYAVGSAGVARFIASATTDVPAHLAIHSGNGQLGATERPLPLPLVVAVVDRFGNPIGGVPVRFEAAQGGGNFDGQPVIDVISRADGRAAAVFTVGAEEGNGVHGAVARILGGGAVDEAIVPATFQASALMPGVPELTAVVGTVLDNTDQPVPGVTIHVVGESGETHTDAEGQFRLEGVPVGEILLEINGTTTDRPGVWPSLEFEMVTVPGRDNDLGRPAYLLPLDVDQGVDVDETTGATLTLDQVPGLALEIAPGSATFPGGSRSGRVSVTVVHGDKVPMVPILGSQPSLFVTIQPPGVIFDPPARLSLPNLDGLRPGEVTEIFSFSHEQGEFLSVGTATVAEDGSVITTDPGFGILEGGWHNPGPEPENNDGTGCSCAECEFCSELLNMCIKKDSGPCDDGRFCTEKDECSNGFCFGTPKPDKPKPPVDFDLRKIAEILNVIESGAKHLGGCESQGVEIGGGMKFELFDRCCEDFDSFLEGGSGSGIISGRIRGVECKPKVALRFPALPAVGFRPYFEVKAGAQFSAAGKTRVCSEKDCAIAFSGQAEGPVGGGLIITAITDDVLAVKAGLSGGVFGSFTYECGWKKREANIGPIKAAVEATLLTFFKVTFEKEIPNSSIRLF